MWHNLRPVIDSRLHSVSRYLTRCGVALALLGGCDRPEIPPDRAATAPAATSPATVTAPATLTIAGQTLQFPPVRLVMQQTEPTVELLLFTEDEAAAGEVNRIYLRLPLEIRDLAELPGTEWTWRASTTDEDDELEGIFLCGDSRHLRPYNVTIVFARQAGQTVLRVDGEFVIHEQGRNPRIVSVHGSLSAMLDRANP